MNFSSKWFQPNFFVSGIHYPKWGPKWEIKLGWNHLQAWKDNNNNYRKHPCISRTFFHKIKAKNRGCGLSMDTSVLGVLKNLIYIHKQRNKQKRKWERFIVVHWLFYSVVAPKGVFECLPANLALQKFQAINFRFTRRTKRSQPVIATRTFRHVR